MTENITIKDKFVTSYKCRFYQMENINVSVVLIFFAKRNIVAVQKMFSFFL